MKRHRLRQRWVWDKGRQPSCPDPDECLWQLRQWLLWLLGTDRRSSHLHHRYWQRWPLSVHHLHRLRFGGDPATADPEPADPEPVIGVDADFGIAGRSDAWAATGKATNQASATSSA